MTLALELSGVTKTYGSGPAEVHALTGVDLSVAESELVAIMGPSGSGKSTPLTRAGTFEDPTEGDVVVHREHVASLSRNPRARLCRRSIGFVFQDFNLLAGLTALENVVRVAPRPSRPGLKPGRLYTSSTPQAGTGWLAVVRTETSRARLPCSAVLPGTGLHQKKRWPSVS